MKYRKLGQTDLEVSEIGHGTFGMGHLWRDGSDEAYLAALQTSFEEGVNFYDTALHYGYGHAEKLLGRFAKSVGRDDLVLATKILPLNETWPAPCGIPVEKVFPRSHIRECAEKSLRNLGTDRIDVLQLHVWQDHWLEEPAFFEEFDLLKKEGKIRYVGVSVNDHDPTSALLLAQSGQADALQVIYNIFDPTAEDALFDLCEEKNVGIIARCPFDEGALTGHIRKGTTFHPEDFRALYFKNDRVQEVETRIERLEGLLGKEAKTLPELALRFCLSDSRVSTVIPGMRTPDHVKKNTGVSDGQLLSPELLAALHTHAWPRNFYPEPA